MPGSSNSFTTGKAAIEAAIFRSGGRTFSSMAAPTSQSTLLTKPMHDPCQVADISRTIPDHSQKCRFTCNRKQKNRANVARTRPVIQPKKGKLPRFAPVWLSADRATHSGYGFPAAAKSPAKKTENEAGSTWRRQAARTSAGPSSCNRASSLLIREKSCP